ncbi:integrase core domain-containing protein [Neoroseomonas rubea]|uniref:integrase core domain-containing protein n=1 Tax=Neoroseomonas rubea TaxID=2748666 RepID=UPI0038CD1761
MLDRATDRLCRGGVAVENLARSASFQAWEKTAPSNPGIKHAVHVTRVRALGQPARGGARFRPAGKSTDNAFIESLNGKVWVECLNAHWFMGFDDARAKCQAWL